MQFCRGFFDGSWPLGSQKYRLCSVLGASFVKCGGSFLVGVWEYIRSRGGLLEVSWAVTLGRWNIRSRYVGVRRCLVASGTGCAYMF